MTMTFEPTREPIIDVVTLADRADWLAFATDNREALIGEYGTLENACWHLLMRGLVLGGGAAPLVLVCFAEPKL